MLGDVMDSFVKFCDRGRRLGQAVLVGMAGLAGQACGPVEISTDLARDVPGPALPPRDGARIFVSGHSLTDEPMPGDLAEIARSLGTPAWVNQQIIPGSTLRMRTRGGPPEPGAEGGDPGWRGYRQGRNREGQGMDVLAELQAPRTVAGPYEVLLVTERHDLGWSLLTQDTVPALRHFHERLHAANPLAQTYLFEPWSDLPDPRQPGAWIAYEREASPMWQCVASRVNASLQAEGRPDRIRSLPAAAALAELLARSLAPAGLPGLGTRPEDTVALLFKDSVHPTRLGSYYIALVSYAVIYRRSPQGAWAPPGVSAEQAASLQAVAATFTEAAQQPLPTLAACRVRWEQRFCDTFWRHWGARTSDALSWVRRYRHVRQCRQAVSREQPDNPLFFDPGADRAFWWPAP